MNYIGSKLSLLDFINNTVISLLKSNNDHRATNKMTFADLFAGTGVVGANFKQNGYRIISNDIQYYSYVLNKHLIENNKILEFTNLIAIFPKTNDYSFEKRQNFILNFLENLDGIKGFVYNNYCLGGTINSEFPRQYFSDENGMKCDTIRKKIEEWKFLNYINESEYYFLLSSLINSIDKYANTASVYGAFLKKLKESAQKKLQLKPYLYTIESNQDNIVYNTDIDELIKEIKGDILYLDPPYNHRQYATNYHLLETIAKNDQPIIKGITGLREYAKEKSLYCSKVNALTSFENLIKNSNFNYIILSYNNEGIISKEDIQRILSKKGKYLQFKMNHKRFKADNNRTHKKNSTIEYLHCVICN